MKKLIFGISLLICSHLTQGQYLFQEIMSLKQAGTERKMYSDRNIRKIRVKSFEDDGSLSKRFFCEKKFSKDHREYKLYTRTGVGEKSLMIGIFNENGSLIKTTDSSENLVRTCHVQYDDKNRITETKTISRSMDEDFLIELTEIHSYAYENENSTNPASMWKIKQGKDSSLILFQPDEQGDIAIEKNARTGAKYYYYYDSRKKITDIVHQSEFKTDLVPDYIFEYDNLEQLIRTTTAASNVREKTNWLYDYKDGLKVLEIIKSGTGETLGRFEYEYE